MKEGDFQKLLSEATQKVGEAGRSAGSSPSPQISEPGGLSAVLPLLSFSENIDQIRSEGMNATAVLLDTLEKYQNALADPQASLRGIQGTLQSLAQGVKELSLLSDRLPSSDPLQKIITEVGIASTVEIERFNRGDYIE